MIRSPPRSPQPRRQSPPVRRRDGHGMAWMGSRTITDSTFSHRNVPSPVINHMKCGIWKSHKGELDISFFFIFFQWWWIFHYYDCYAWLHEMTEKLRTSEIGPGAQRVLNHHYLPRALQPLWAETLGPAIVFFENASASGAAMGLKKERKMMVLFVPWMINLVHVSKGKKLWNWGYSGSIDEFNQLCCAMILTDILWQNVCDMIDETINIYVI